MLFKASAPGSLMLLGEYAVLHGKQALVCAINKRMTVTLAPREDQRIILKSTLGEHVTTVSALQAVVPFQFVLSVLKSFRKELRKGCEITIASEFSDKVGFASSAAVTVATLSAVSAWLNIELSDNEFILRARKIIQSVQGIGSGADVAACTLGGIVSYRMRPFLAEKLTATHPISVIYSGSKTPTVEAILHVKKRFLTHTKIYQQLLQTMGHCAEQGIEAVIKQNWPMLGDIMNIQQGLMDSLGVNTPILQELTDQLRQQSTILGAKISGSGLGDCVVGLGSVSQEIAPLAIEMSSRGVFCEKI